MSPALHKGKVDSRENRICCWQPDPPSIEEVIAALLEIADSQFQDKLLSEAKRAGKIRAKRNG